MFSVAFVPSHLHSQTANRVAVGSSARPVGTVRGYEAQPRGAQAAQFGGAQQNAGARHGVHHQQNHQGAETVVLRPQQHVVLQAEADAAQRVLRQSNGNFNLRRRHANQAVPSHVAAADPAATLADPIGPEEIARSIQILRSRGFEITPPLDVEDRVDQDPSIAPATELPPSMAADEMVIELPPLAPNDRPLPIRLNVLFNCVPRNRRDATPDPVYIPPPREPRGRAFGHAIPSTVATPLLTLGGTGQYGLVGASRV